MKKTGERKESRDTREASETHGTRGTSATRKSRGTKATSFGKERTVYKIAACGIFSALALIAFVIESLFPPFFIPSARMGISNIFVLLAAIGAASGILVGLATVLILRIIPKRYMSGGLYEVIYGTNSRYK